jgi:hypothetical protein
MDKMVFLLLCQVNVQFMEEKLRVLLCRLLNLSLYFRCFIIHTSLLPFRENEALNRLQWHVESVVTDCL